MRLGVDVGSVRVGVAASDDRGVLATPLLTVAADVEAVAALVAEHAAMEVVIGLPRTLGGAEGPSARSARTYADALAARVAPVPVRLLDERFTSVDAHRALRESGVAGRRQRAVVDQVAAVLILQAALDQERHSGRPPGEPAGPGATRRRKPRTRDGGR